LHSSHRNAYGWLRSSTFIATFLTVTVGYSFGGLTVVFSLLVFRQQAYPPPHLHIKCSVEVGVHQPLIRDVKCRLVLSSDVVREIAAIGRLYRAKQVAVQRAAQPSTQKEGWTFRDGEYAGFRSFQLACFACEFSRRRRAGCAVEDCPCELALALCSLVASVPRNCNSFFGDEALSYASRNDRLQARTPLVDRYSHREK